MPSIHHTQRKKAEQIGVMLNQDGDYIEAHWVERNQKVYGVSAAEAIAQAIALQSMFAKADGLRIYHSPRDKRLIQMELNGTPVNDGFTTPHELAENFELNVATNELTQRMVEHVVAVKRIKGIPTDGAIAYGEGVMAGDNPFDEHSDEAEKWWADWDAAADAAPEPRDKKGGSVVSERFRTKYAEAGHPNTCNDWLAQILNNLVGDKKKFKLDLFEEICALNGVDTGKYRREGRGWEGRIRMTGRNVLSNKVFKAGGLLVLPERLGGNRKAPADWMSAQKYKPKGNKK